MRVRDSLSKNYLTYLRISCLSGTGVNSIADGISLSDDSLGTEAITGAGSTNVILLSAAVVLTLSWCGVGDSDANVHSGAPGVGDGDADVHSGAPGVGDSDANLNTGAPGVSLVLT